MNAIRGLVLVAVCAGACFAFGDEPPPPPVAVCVEAQPEVSVASQILSLESDDFRTRQAASQELTDLGPTAIDPLRNAVPELDREAATRAIDVLSQLARSKDPATSARALAALKSLEESTEDHVTTLVRNDAASRAPLPSFDRTTLGVRRAGGFNMRIRGNGGGLQVQGLNIQAGQDVRITVSINNDERTITLQEGGKTTKLQDKNGKDIRIHVAETVNGQEAVKEFAADNLEDLKQKHPDAVPIYERLNGAVGNGGVNLQNVVGNAAAPAPDPDAQKDYDAARTKFLDLGRQMQKARRDDPQALGALEKDRREAREAMLEAWRKLRVGN